MRLSDSYASTVVRWCGWNLSARAAFGVLARTEMEVPNPLATPITTLPDSGETLVAQVIR